MYVTQITVYSMEKNLLYKLTNIILFDDEAFEKEKLIPALLRKTKVNKRERPAGGKRKVDSTINICFLATFSYCCVNGRLIGLLFNENTRCSGQQCDV